jgi:hypothetical protein
VTSTVGASFAICDMSFSFVIVVFPSLLREFLGANGLIHHARLAADLATASRSFLKIGISETGVFRGQGLRIRRAATVAHDTYSTEPDGLGAPAGSLLESRLCRGGTRLHERARPQPRNLYCDAIGTRHALPVRLPNTSASMTRRGPEMRAVDRIFAHCSALRLRSFFGGLVGRAVVRVEKSPRATLSA